MLYHTNRVKEWAYELESTYPNKRIQLIVNKSDISASKEGIAISAGINGAGKSMQLAWQGYRQRVVQATSRHLHRRV